MVDIQEPSRPYRLFSLRSKENNMSIAGSMATIINDGTNWIVLSYSIGPLL